MSGPVERLAPRRVLYVVGAGRSGTSTLAGVAGLLGLHVPQPEVAADATNPKGFGEPQWVVDLHDRLLAEAGVQVGDARPVAWEETARVGSRPPVREEVRAWLAQQLQEAPELVVKDPRLSWFLDLWVSATTAGDAVPVFATMLRPPAEVAASRQKYYRNRLGAAHLAAGWLSMLLHTERATREGRRAFVRYDDLLSDVRGVATSVGERLDLVGFRRADEAAWQEVERFVDPDLRRVSGSLADLGLPSRLHDLVAEAWQQLDRMAEPDGDTAEARGTLDQVRESYVGLYEEAEAITRSSVVAASTRRRVRGGGPGGQQGLPDRPDRPGSADRPGGPDRPGGRPGRPAAPSPDRSWRARVPAPLRRVYRRLVPRK